MIESGELKEEDKLPSERKLSELYNISRHTVRQALKELEILGYIYSFQGKGTFISSQKVNQELLKFYSFTDEMIKLSKTPKSKVLDFNIIKINNKIGKIMDMEEGDKVYKFTRLRLADNEPMMIETTYLPYELFPEITVELLEKMPLYSILREKYNIKKMSGKESFMAIIADNSESELLEYNNGLPSMLIERITNSNNRIIEYTRSIARGDKFIYTINMD